MAHNICGGRNVIDIKTTGGRKEGRTPVDVGSGVNPIKLINSKLLFHYLIPQLILNCGTVVIEFHQHTLKTF